MSGVPRCSAYERDAVRGMKSAKVGGYVWNNRTRWCAVVAAAAVALCVSMQTVKAGVRQHKGNKAKPFVLPKPTGPFKVGMRRLTMTDMDRGEPTTPNTNDHRTFVVVLFYPAGETPANSRAEYMAELMADIWAKDRGLWQRFQLNIVTHAFTNVSVAPQPIRAQIVVFSHGLFSLPENYQVVLTELASHGFVVAAINHTYASTASVWPSGRFVSDRIWPHGFASPENRRRALARYLSTWTDDVRFVISELARLDGDASFFLTGRLNMDRVGLCGHGYGGRSAAAVLDADPRVKAGVTLQAVAPDGKQQPGSGKPRLDIETSRSGPGAPTTPGARREPTQLSLVVAGAIHRSFSDEDLLRGRFARRLPNPEAAPKVIHPSRVLEITCAYMVAFFDRHLRDGKNDLLDQTKPPFAEVELVR